jgi:hypothetical protein
LATLEERPDAQPATRSPASRAPIETSNPTFGPAYWVLGALAALPSLLCALAFLLPRARASWLPPIGSGTLLGLLLAGLALLAAGIHRLDYPAWSQPLVTTLPTVGLYLPAAVLHGQTAARVNNDPDPIVALPLLATWLLLVAAAVVTLAVGLLVGRHAPSFCGSSLAPLPVVLAWMLVLTPDFREEVVTAALASAFALLALTTFVAWVVPADYRPLVPLAAIGLQFGAFWELRLPWPAFGGAIRPVIWLDVLLFVGLVVAVGSAPYCAAWVRRAGWPELQRLLRH